jgi:hypothetical protein
MPRGLRPLEVAQQPRLSGYGIRCALMPRVARLLRTNYQRIRGSAHAVKASQACRRLSSRWIAGPLAGSARHRARHRRRVRRPPAGVPDGCGGDTTAATSRSRRARATGQEHDGVRGVQPDIDDIVLLVLRLFLPAAHERPAVTGKLCRGHLRQGQLSFQRRHQPWFRSASSTGRAGGSCTPRSRPAGPRGGCGPKHPAVVMLAPARLPGRRRARSARHRLPACAPGSARARGESGVIMPWFARSRRLAVSSLAVVSWLTSRGRVMLSPGRSRRPCRRPAGGSRTIPCSAR